MKEEIWKEVQEARATRRIVMAGKKYRYSPKKPIKKPITINTRAEKEPCTSAILAIILLSLGYKQILIAEALQVSKQYISFIKKRYAVGFISGEEWQERFFKFQTELKRITNRGEL